MPKGQWRFSGFSEVKRLAVACGLAGVIAALALRMAAAAQVPAPTGLHRSSRLMLLAMIRMELTA